MASYKFTEAQQRAFDLYNQRQNVFITGPGGSGKSEFIKAVVKNAKKNRLNYQVCALTGCAAVLLKCRAKTIHSWAGIGLGKGDINKITERVYKKKYPKNNWRETQLLIIDEVSMMSEKLLNLLDAVAKKCRGNNRPFGGIQLLFSGDFPIISSWR